MDTSGMTNANNRNDDIGEDEKNFLNVADVKDSNNVLNYGCIHTPRVMKLLSRFKLAEPNIILLPRVGLITSETCNSTMETETVMYFDFYHDKNIEVEHGKNKIIYTSRKKEKFIIDVQISEVVYQSYRRNIHGFTVVKDTKRLGLIKCEVLNREEFSSSLLKLDTSIFNDYYYS